VLAGQSARDIFEAVAGALGQMGKTTGETDSALKSLTAMVNTGTVSMDALKTQFGAALPTALQATADQLGITRDELAKLIASGKALTVEVLPALAEGLTKATQNNGEITGLTQAWNLLTSAARLSVEAIVEIPGVMSAAGAAMAGIRAVVSGVGLAAAATSEALTLAGQSIAALAAVASSPLKIKDALADLSQKSGEAGQRIDHLAERLGLAKPPADDLAGAHSKLVAELDKGVTATTGLAGEQKKLVAELDKGVTATTGLAGEQKKLVAELDKGGTATTGMAGEQKKLVAELDKGGTATTGLAGEQKKLVAELDKGGTASAKAQESTAALVVHTDLANTAFKNLTDAVRATNDIQKTHDQTAISAIGISGQQKDALEAEATAADHAADSAQELVRIKSASLDVAQRYLDGLRQEVAGIASVGDKMRERIRLAEEDVGKKQLEVSATKAFAEAQDLVAEKTRISAETLKDNSKRVGELRSAYDAAEQALKNANKLHDDGKISNEAYAEAVKKQRDALALYKDSLGDTVANLKLKEEADKRQSSLTEKAIIADIAAAKAGQDIARAKGDETEAIRLGIEIKEREADQSHALAEGKKKEFDNARASADARIAEIKASGDMTAALRAEIQALNDGVAAKKIDADISEQSARQASAQVDIAKNQADAAKAQADALKSLAGSSDQAKRGLNSVSVETAGLAQELGLSGKGVEDFSRKFSEVLEPAIRATMSQFNGIAPSADRYIEAFSGAFNAASDAAKQYAGSLDYVSGLTERLQQASSGAGGELSALADQADRAKGGVSGLGDEEMGPLRDALADARRQLESLKDSARSTLSSLQQELAQMSGNYVKAEELRLASRKADLESQLAIARAQNNVAAESMLSEAIATLDQIATRKIAQARQQETDALAQTSQSSSQASAAAGQLATASVNAGAAASQMAAATAANQAANQAATAANQAANQAAHSQLATATQAAHTAASALGSVASASVTLGGAAQQLENAASMLSSTARSSANSAAQPALGVRSTPRDSSSGSERPSGETGRGETGRGETPSGDPSPSSGNSPAPAQNYTTHINIAGVLDLNDRATLESLTRKLSPILSDLMRKSA
jgi:tape measure domain-containing protein